MGGFRPSAQNSLTPEFTPERAHHHAVGCLSFLDKALRRPTQVCPDRVDTSYQIEGLTSGSALQSFKRHRVDENALAADQRR